MKRYVSVGLLLYFLTTLCLVVREIYHEPLVAKSHQIVEQESLTQYMSAGKEKKPLPEREGFLSARFAQWNDLCLKSGNKYWTRAPATFITSRVFATSLFPISLSQDLFFASFQCLYHASFGDMDHCQRYWQRIKKNLLGLVATPCSILSPDLVTNHFIPVGGENRAICPYGKLYSAEAIELYPKTVEEVQEIVREAKRLNKKISIAGKLFSQGKQALSTDSHQILLRLDALNQIEIDVENLRVRCGANATFEEIQAKANENLLAVRVMQASNPFSIGGSLSINCHGWDHRCGSIDQTVCSIKVVDSDGELHELFPGDELFHLVIGGLGGFGVIVEAELSLTPNTLLKYKPELVAPKEYVHYFENRVMQDPNIALHYFRLSLEPGKLFQEGIAANYIESGPPQKGHLMGESEKGRVIDRIELQTLRRMRGLYRVAWEAERKQALEEVELTRNQVMQPPIRAILSESNLDTEWLQEFFIPPEHLPMFLEKLAVILEREKVALLNASIRYISKNDSRSFNYCPEGKRFAVVLFFNQSLDPKEVARAKKWIREAVDLVNQFGGSYYLAYQQIPTLSQFQKSYADWNTTKTLKQKWDPEARFDSGFFSDYLTVSEPLLEKPPEYHKLFSKKGGMRDEIAAFIDKIFMQLDTKKFFHLVDDLLEVTPHTKELYPLLLNRIGEAKKGRIATLKDSFTSLRLLKNEIALQAKELIGDQPLNGYLEIGYPGRMIRPLKKQLSLSGKMIVVNGEQSISDYLQTGIPTPVDQFVPLNDYEPIRADSVATESVDLVSLFIGLHHIPEEKLTPFIRSIERVLRPGGSLILMDHDANSGQMREFLSLIHSIFNVGTYVPAVDEKGEYRNFQPLSYWIALVEKNGLMWDGQQPKIRKGDPSLNSLIRFNKPERSAPIVNRPGIQTYLTGPEWQNVRSSQAYAAFIEHTPFYSYPYFREIGNFWHVYKESIRAARNHYSLMEVLTSEYTWMNTFIGFMMTIEYGVKGLISLPLSFIYTQEAIQEPLTTQVLLKGNHPLLDPEVICLEKNGRSTRVEIPRYKLGTKVLQRLALSGEDFLSIEGQERVQADLVIDRDAPIPEIPVGKLLYQTKLVSQTPKTLLAYEIPVRALAETIRTLSPIGMEFDLIHDF